jgi:patatin-like phospholipase/acyl hydrolase
MYRILALDGGGIRGLVSLEILKRIDVEVAGFVARADLIAGTSTGGIVALGLAAGKSLDDLINLYAGRGKEIFDDSWMDDLRDLGGVSGAQYDQRNLARILRAFFGDRQLKELGRRVLIPAFDLDNEHPAPAKRCWGPKFFHNFPGSDSDGDESVVSVALRTSAAPTFFPSHEGYIDGGVVANNPSLAAVAQTQDARNRGPRPALDDIHLLSIGTGLNLSFIRGAELDWGYAQWAKPLVSLLFDASMGIADYQCRQLLKDNYRRIAPVFPPDVNIKLDGVSRIPELRSFGRHAALADARSGDDVVAWLRRVGW